MIFRVIGLGILGLAGFKLLKRRKLPMNSAYAPDQPHDSYTDIRDAGPDAMRDRPDGEWTGTDETLDGSFPASDPPGKY